MAVINNMIDYQTEVLLDDMFNEPECGLEHPRLEGNLCILELDHACTFHEDMLGNTWRGQPDDD